MIPRACLLRTALWAAAVSLIAAAPTDSRSTIQSTQNAGDVVSEQTYVPEPLSANLTYSDVTRRAGNFYLRVMPLGASITEGVASSDGNGYRKWLRDTLRYNGWQVNMVGSKQNGNMKDKASQPFFLSHNSGC